MSSIDSARTQRYFRSHHITNETIKLMMMQVVIGKNGRKLPRSITMSPGRRPSPSFCNHGHSRPTAINNNPIAISVRCTAAVGLSPYKTPSNNVLSAPLDDFRWCRYKVGVPVFVRPRVRFSSRSITSSSPHLRALVFSSYAKTLYGCPGSVAEPESANCGSLTSTVEDLSCGMMTTNAPIGHRCWRAPS
jgi:hypothetical protein